MLQTRHAIECRIRILSQNGDNIVIHRKDIGIGLVKQRLIIDQLIVFKILVYNTIRSIDTQQDIGHTVLHRIGLLHRSDAKFFQRFSGPVYRILIDGIFCYDHSRIR